MSGVFIIFISLVLNLLSFAAPPPAAAQTANCRWERPDGSLPTGPTGNYLNITWAPQCSCPSTDNRAGYTVYKLNNSSRWVWKGGCDSPASAVGSSKCYELLGQEEKQQTCPDFQGASMGNALGECGSCYSDTDCSQRQALYPDYQELVWHCQPAATLTATPPPIATLPAEVTATPAPACSIDFNGNGYFDEADEVTIKAAANSPACSFGSEESNCIIDFNGNGYFDEADEVTIKAAANSPACSFQL